MIPRLTFLIRLAACIAVASAVTFCQQAQAPVRELEGAPAKALSRKNPYDSDRSAIRAGHKVFLEHCAQCHGTEARGSSHAPNLHSASIRRASPGEIYWVLTNGLMWHGMPEWSGLPPERRWQIVTYLKSLQ